MKDTLDKIKAELTETYSLLSMIEVKGNSVDALAEARTRLRSAFDTAKKKAAELEAKEPNTPGGRKERDHG